MKKAKSGHKKPVIILTLISAFFVASVVLLYVVLKLEIERLTKEKIYLEETLEAKNNETVMLQVEVQKLETEERIIQLAESRLEMEKLSEPNIVIEVEKDQLDEVVKEINSKYE
ncbi:MAG: hypothetical protein HF314_08805 [Ignavibacteria bacterium]|jgi:cell division protein FtsL|nr:hypothetical protein [Ignavibacteria bacterium]MCU7503160.1 hypothetical protein [Ignavibacteria bacterium]MCU7518038.1 hypothetical protein [Ignavibacteria bacterium]